MLSDILAKLSNTQASKTVDVFVPSANKIIKFKQLSAKQQKDLIKTGLDGAVSSITINNVINDIITNNSLESHNFNIFDKIPIILALRVDSLGNTFKHEDITINLQEITNKQLTFGSQVYETCIQYKNEILVDVSVPNLQDDTDVNSFAKENIQSNKEITISNAIVALFSYEIVKFVKNLQIQGCEFDYTKLSLADRLTVLDALPAAINKEIIDFIQQFRLEESKYLTVDNVDISIDARLFS